MNKIFSIDQEIEQILALIESDKSVLSKLSVGELELINKYLTEKKEFLSDLSEE